MDMQHSLVQLIDLPDEILLIIFMKLNNEDILYSLMDINTRFNQILSDSIFVSCLTLLKCTRVLDYFIYPLPDAMLDRFCLQIIPQIFHKIRWLNIESSSMERILCAAEYPNLSGLSLHNATEETVISIFIERTSFRRIDKNQISNLIIMITDVGKRRLMEYTITTVCEHVFDVFTNLRYLNISSSDYIDFPRLSFDNPLPTFFSSTLMELRINLSNSNDCFYLLDGRFNQLHNLYVNIAFIFPPSVITSNKDKIPNLRYFSLNCQSEVSFYDEVIVPLLHRMSNLENLSLHFAVKDLHRFIDGYDLKKNIISYLSQLNNFVFNIRSIISLDNQISFPSNDDIQLTFTNFPKNQIISCVDYFPKAKSSLCHIYSYPYTKNYYHNITNNFFHGLFECVRKISLFDERPFEHDFFIRITQSFPFITSLSLNNRKAQKLKNNNIDYPLIKYSHLDDLHLIDVHKDYVELFLDDTKTFLPDKISLEIEYRPLRKVTYNFKRDAMRINCSKVTDLSIPAKFKLSQHFKTYFSNVIRSLFYS